MKLPAYFRSLAARFFHWSQTENELEEELRSHIKLRADDLERVGLTRADAERRARIGSEIRHRVALGRTGSSKRAQCSRASSLPDGQTVGPQRWC